MDAPPGSILVVCTANVCRSPTAAIALRRGLEKDSALSAVTVVSAGTRARRGFSICEVAYRSTDVEHRDLAKEHRSREITADILAEADLVIVLEREHRSTLAQMSPAARPKTFTLLEAVALAEGALEQGDRDVAKSVKDVARLLNSLRGFVVVPEKPRRRFSREPQDALTIADGHGLAERKHRAAIEETDAAASRLADALRSLAA